jgi:hypothetical protein
MFFSEEMIRHKKQQHKEKQTEIAAGTSSKSKDSDDELIGKKQIALLDLLIKVSEDGKILSDEDIREEVILY